MKLTQICLFMMALNFASCGHKSSEAQSLFAISDKVTIQKPFEIKAEVNEKNCIDNLLTKELESGESIKKLIVNTDTVFCNGVRIRLKTYQFASKKYKAFGFIESNSGHKSCLLEDGDLTHTRFLGDKGTLLGDDIAVLLGGHGYDSDKKIIPSDHRLARNVKFEWGGYSGEIGIVEKNKLRCWAIQ